MALRLVGAAGRLLIAAGGLLLLFVAYQLFGTNLVEARNQNALREQFERQLVEAEPPPVPSGGSEAPVTVPPPAPGDPIGRMEIPRIGVDRILVEGISVEDLKKGPGHYPDAPMPGGQGNVAIAGHRTTYGAPFYRLDELVVGDPIIVSSPQGQFRYEVSESLVVEPDRVDVVAPTPDARLTLVTCTPRFSARQRLIVVAALVGEPLSPPGPPLPSATPGAVGPDQEASRLTGDLAAEEASAGPAVAWGLAAGAVALLVWLVGRRWRRWPAYLLGAPAFLVVLAMFFESLSRLLPASL
ncbi:MAG: class E sortase [Actinobacteria bacterium]|nr:class E sortase [Actinomycetota bacterium]